MRVKHIYSSLIVFLLTACGFEPMAAKSTKAYDQQSLPAAVSAVQIQAKSPEQLRMVSQQFSVELEDLINPGGKTDHKEYLLDVWLNPYIQPGLIAPDGKAQRFLVYLYSTYTLTRLSDSKVLEYGKMNRNSSYSNLPNSYYSTYIAEQDTIKRLNKELAEQYRMKLASILSAPPQDAGEKQAPDSPPPAAMPENTILFPAGQSF